MTSSERADSTTLPSKALQVPARTLLVLAVTAVMSLIFATAAWPACLVQAAETSLQGRAQPAENGTEEAPLPTGPRVQIENISPAILVDEDEITVTVRLSGLSPEESTARLMTFIHADPFLNAEHMDKFLTEKPVEGWAAAEITLDAKTLAEATDEVAVDLKIQVEGSPLWNPAAWGPYGVTVRLLELREPGPTGPPQDQSLLIWHAPGSEGDVQANVLLSNAFLFGAGLPPNVDDFWVEGVTAQLARTQLQPPAEPPSDENNIESLDTDQSSGGPSGPVLPKEVVLTPEQDADLSLLATVGANEMFAAAWDSYVEATDQAIEVAPFSVVQNVLVANDDWLTEAVLRNAGGATVLSGPRGVGTLVTAQQPASPLYERATGEGVTRVLDSWAEGAQLLTEPTASRAEAFTNLQKLRGATALMATEHGMHPTSDPQAFGLLGDGIDTDQPSLWLNVPFTAVPENFPDRLDALLDAPWVQPVTLQDTLATWVSQVPRMPLPDRYPASQEALRPALQKLSAEYDQALAVAEASPEPAEVMEPINQAALSAVAAGLTVEERTVRLDNALEVLRATTDVVSVIPSQTVNVMGRNAPFPVTVSNSGPTALEVEVVLEPEDARLQARSPALATVPAGGSVSLHIPVVAVGTGKIGVVVNAATTDGYPLASSERIDVRLLAGWGDTLTLVIGSVVALLFIVGLVRTLRKGRRQLVLTTGGHAHERKS